MKTSRGLQAGFATGLRASRCTHAALAAFALSSLISVIGLTFSSTAQAQAVGLNLSPKTAVVVDGTPDIDAAIAQRNWTQALARLDTRIASNPSDVQAQFKRATVLAHLGRDDDAIVAFTTLTQRYPELPEPYNNLAALYAKHQRYIEARGALESAIRANPAFPLAYRNLGDVYLRLSADAYARAAALNPADPSSAARRTQIAAIATPAAVPSASVVPPATALPAPAVGVQAPVTPGLMLHR